MVKGQAVHAPQYSVAAAEGEAADPDRGAGAGRDGQAVGQQRVIQLAQARAGTDFRHAAGEDDRALRRQVDDDAGSG